MEFSFFIKGFIIGFSIAATIGPIALLCIKRSLTRGWFSGFICGLGAAIADTAYGAIAAFGLTFISSFLIAQKMWFQSFGSIFLFYLGLQIFFEKPKIDKKAEKHKGYLSDLFTIFFLTVTNPLTILFFIAVFAGAGLVVTDGDYNSASLAVLGVFIGSALWYYLLAHLVGFFYKRTKDKFLVWVNRISGAVIILFAIFIVFTLVSGLF